MAAAAGKLRFPSIEYQSLKNPTIRWKTCHRSLRLPSPIVLFSYNFPSIFFFLRGYFCQRQIGVAKDTRDSALAAGYGRSKTESLRPRRFANPIFVSRRICSCVCSLPYSGRSAVSNCVCLFVCADSRLGPADPLRPGARRWIVRMPAVDSSAQQPLRRARRRR